MRVNNRLFILNLGFEIIFNNFIRLVKTNVFLLRIKYIVFFLKYVFNASNML